MSEQTTIRQLLERWKRRHSEGEKAWLTSCEGMWPKCRCCDEWWPCSDRSDAIAALEILSASERRGRGTREQRQSPAYIYVYDPGAGSFLPGAPTNEETL